MGKYYIVISLFILASCNTLKHIPKKEAIKVVNFSFYSDRGFYISPESPPEKHIPRAFVDYIFLPEANYKHLESELLPTTIWVVEKINLDSCLNEVVSRMVQLGANAIYNFKMESFEESYLDFSNPIIIEGIRISGFAVKVNLEN